MNPLTLLKTAKTKANLVNAYAFFWNDALSCVSVFTGILKPVLYGKKGINRLEWAFGRPWGSIFLSLCYKCRHHRWKWKEKIKTNKSLIIHLPYTEGKVRGFEGRTNLWAISNTSVDGKHMQRHYSHY